MTHEGDHWQLVRENEALRCQVAALQAEAARFKTTLYSIGDAVMAADADGNVLQMNVVAEALTGWSEAGAQGRPIAQVFKIVNEETRAEVESPVTHVLREGVVVGLANHTLLIAKDGTERPIADSGAPIRNDKGEMTGVVLVFRDQTAERSAQKAIEDSEVRFRTVFEGSPLGKSMTGIDGRMSVNRAFCELLGYSAEELRTRKWQELTHPDDVEESAKIVKSLLDGDTANAHYEKRYVHKSDQVIWTDVTTTLARDAQGSPLFFITTVSDITERKRAEVELRNSERRYRTLADSLPHLVWTCRPDGPCDYVSPRWVDYTGIPEADQLGYRWLEQLHPDDRERVIAEWSEVAPRGGAFDIEFRIRRKDGQHRWFRTRAIPFRDNDGRLVKWFGSNTDIDDYKRAEESLQKARDRLEEAQRVARLGDWAWDNLADVITGSAEFFRLFDVAPPELTRFAQFMECLHPDDRERVGQNVADALKQDRPYDTDYRVKLRDGGWRDINARGCILAGAEGKVVRMTGTCVDITERKRAEQQIARLNCELEARVVERTSQLEDAMELVQKIISSSPVGVFACRADGPCVLANPAVARTSGATVEKMLQLNFHELDSWKKNGLFDKVQTALATGTDQRAEIHLTTTFGQDAWLNYTIARFERGGTPHFLMLVEDITERKRMEAALRDSEERTRTTLYAIGDGVISTDAAERVTQMNPVAEVLTGWCEAAARGQPLAQIFKLLNEETRAAVESPSTRVLREGVIVGLANHTMLIAKDGSERPIADSGAPIRNEAGETTGVVLVFRDQTKERAVQQALHDRMVQLQEANQELEAFSYSVSHDLRAPLRAIDGFTHILADDYAPHLGAEGLRLCSVVRDNAARMSRLIDDLLAFSRLGRAEMSLSLVDMGAMASSIFHELTAPEGRARIDFEVGALPAAFADPTLMRQVWTNLLSNAIKFSSKRQRAVIRVSAERCGGENVYTVQDNGAGFEMQYADKLFGVFQRLHTSREFEGTGVGLALVQRVIRRHEGRVWAEGEPEQGAAFHFALKIEGD